VNGHSWSGAKIVLRRLTVWPSRQPNRSISPLPTSAAVRSAMNACRCSSGMTNSGYIGR
jgi:hypothetical protein